MQMGHLEEAGPRAPPCTRPSAQILVGRYIFLKGWGHECGSPISGSREAS